MGLGRGRGVEPVFESAPVLRIGRHGDDARIGDLVTAVTGRGSPRIVANHGRATSPRAVLAALMAHNERGRPFPRAVRDAADEAAQRADHHDEGRQDLTGQRVITIDPEGAKDHDDAIAVERDGDAIRLWVHIADVSYYVPSGGAVDREASRRGTSVYVPGAVDPMLPAVLSNDVCSLRPGVDRKVVTVEILVDPEGSVVSSRFFRSTIHSRRRLTYPQVDAYFAGGALGDAELESDIAVARECAERLRRKREAAGSLTISTSEPVFTWNEDRLVGIELESQTDSHRLIEDCMVSANEAVAQYLLRRGVPAVYRYHEDPAESAIVELYERLTALGVALPSLPEDPLSPERCAQAACDASEAIAAHVRRHGGGQALPVLVLRSLRQAYYSSENSTHSGLASAGYLHFTSPIRRYPDLVVHRALLAALGIDDQAPDGLACSDAAEVSSLAEREAVAIERRADRICRAFLVADEVDTDRDRVYEGEVVGIGEAGVFVAFNEGLLEGYLPARVIPGDWWNQDHLGIALVGEESGRRIAIGDRIDVQVADVDPVRGRVDLVPAGTPRRPEGAPGPRGRSGSGRTRPSSPRGGNRYQRRRR